MDAIHPRWSPGTYLLYAGLFVLVGAATVLLTYLAAEHGESGFALYSLLVFAAFSLVALVLRRRGDRPITAGLFAYASVGLFAVFVLATWSWFGWLDSENSLLQGFDVGRLSAFLLVLIAAAAALRAFKFPLLMLVVAESIWLFLTDLLSGGGDWSAVVTIAIGVVFLIWALAVDGGPNRPYGMWLHVAAGLTIGGGLLWFLHHGHVEWGVVAVAGVIYLRLGGAFGRASWAVLGSIGVLAAAAHYATAFSHAHVSTSGASTGGSRAWVPALVFALAALVLLGSGELLGRRATLRPD